MHPWREFRSLTEWTLLWANLEDDMGVTCFLDQTVTLDRHLNQAERRCTIAHETEHIRRGPVPDDDRLAAREERAVDQAVARRLIELHPLGEALAWAHNLPEAAEELWVDLETLRTRLAHLHPSERAYLKRRLEHHDPNPEATAGRCPHPRLACAECEHRTVCPSAGTRRAASAGQP